MDPFKKDDTNSHENALLNLDESTSTDQTNSGNTSTDGVNEN